MFPITVFPRPSVITSVVVAVSVVSGVAFGVAAGGTLVLIAAARKL